MLSRNTITIELESLLTETSLDSVLEKAARTDTVIVDATSLKRVSVRLLEAFVKIKKAMLRNGRRGIVRLVVHSAPIHRTLEVTGLRKLFELYASLETAGAEHGKSGPAPAQRPAA